MSQTNEMTPSNDNLEFVKSKAKTWLPLVAAWTPIVIGLGHQAAMLFFGVERIYVFVSPPQYIYPTTSLEFSWWILLTLISGIGAFTIATHRIREAPMRAAIPFYAYLVYLLIFVKPV